MANVSGDPEAVLQAQEAVKAAEAEHARAVAAASVGFHVYDRDGDGVLDADELELRSVIMHRAAAARRAMDVDEDGMVCEREFALGKQFEAAAVVTGAKKTLMAAQASGNVNAMEVAQQAA